MGKKQKQIMITIICMVCILSTVLTLPAAAAETESWQIVRVACGINNALYLNEDGEPEGYCSEYLTALAKINHWQLTFVEGSWNDSVQRLYDGEIDLLLPTQMTDLRKGTMGFSTAIGGYQPIGLFAKGDSTFCYDDFTSFDGCKIAVSEGTSNEEALKAYAKENNFTFETVYLDAVEDKMQALADGSVDMIVFSTLNDVPDGKVVAMLDYLPFYYCTRIDDTDLLDTLNEGMNQMLIRHPDLVQDVFYNFMNKNITFAYTKEEQAEIQNHGDIIVGVYMDTAPLFDVAADGSFTGIYTDIIHRIEALSGLDIEIKALSRKEYAFDYLNRGAIDFILGSSDQALKYSDDEGYIQSEGVMDYYTVGITKSNFAKTETDELVFALTSGRRYWTSVIQKRCPNATFEYYATSKECLNAVQDGDADVTLLNSWEYNYHSKNHRFENLLEWENTRTLSQTVFVSLEDQNALIRSVLDKAIEQISNAEKEAFITSNLNRPYNSYEFKDKLYDMRHTLIVFALIILIGIVGFAVYEVMRRKSMHILEDKNQQLKSASEAKDMFLSRMSHELRTPLNAINGYATVMEQNLSEHTCDEQNMRTYIEAILRAVKYQLAIIGDLLDIQKIESGKMELQPIEVDSAAYMDNIVAMIAPEAKEKHIDFAYERLSNVNDSYLLDGVRFQQVLLNVLHNAVKFTPEGGRVRMTAEVVDQSESANTLKFVISDNGIGMSEDFQQNYLFRRFAQEYKGNTSPYEGCGTGLAISRDIMHLMGGEITCQSEQGVGSTFTIILTVKHIRKRKNHVKYDNFAEYDLSGIRILLCEDNKMNQDMERRLLEKMNCTVAIANDGRIGVDMFADSAEGTYQIVLMDIRMPNMDGLTATRAIRTLDRQDAKTVPIVAVSANSFQEDIQKSLDAGMNAHLAKPVDVQMLYETIKKCCEKV